MANTTEGKAKSVSLQAQKGSRPVGRPPKLTPEQKAEVYAELEQYIRETDDPTIPGFLSENQVAWDYDVTRDNLNDWEEFSTLIKKAITKQEGYLVRQGGAGKYNPTIAIFRLKQPQHGYKDRVDTDITTAGEKLGVTLSADQADQLIRARAKRNSADL